MTYGNICRPYPETIDALECRLREADYAVRNKDLLIRSLRAENDELRQANAGMVSHIQRQDAELATHLERNASLVAEIEMHKLRVSETFTTPTITPCQHDLPPTRAEIIANELSDRLVRRNKANEERD